MSNFRHPEISHAIEEMHRYVQACADEHSTEAANLVYSVKHLTQQHGQWDAYLYATLLLHDILDVLQKGKRSFKYMSEEEQKDLSAEFRKDASALAGILNKVYEDWGGPDRISFDTAEKEKGHLLGAPSHVPEIKPSEKKNPFRFFLPKR